MRDGETFTARMDSGIAHVGDHVGTMEVGVKPGLSAIEALIDENNALRDRVAELERQLHALD